VVQETRLYDADKDETRSMRTKEEANDYRYFPDPDLLPVVLDEAYIESLRAKLPELPDQKAQRFQQQYGLPAYDAQLLTASRELAGFYEAVAAAVPQDAKLAANWVMGDFSAALNKDGLEAGESRLSAARLGGLLARIVDETLSGKLAKEVFEVMWADGSEADTVIEARGLKQITDAGAIGKVIDDIIAANPKQLADYRSGKDKLFGFFVGQAMKATGGKANPALLNELLKQKLAP
jgi:aspartyl-tRNA(Asn)/glutamyl-tRNA(Gln) amidotransferase subunit B